MLRSGPGRLDICRSWSRRPWGSCFRPGRRRAGSPGCRPSTAAARSWTSPIVTPRTPPWKAA